MTIRAIETVYNGYRFRSRLEARWAVFFDALGLEYRYEAEGYDLGEVGFYLPDFQLTQSEIPAWVEIKGMYPNEHELAKAGELAKHSKGHVFIFYGDCWTPEPGEDNGIMFDERGRRVGQGVSFACCEECQHISIMSQNGYGCGTCGYSIVKNYGRIKQAYWTARGARFEHGESGG